MSWIEEIDKESAEGDLQKVYEEIKSKRGKLSNIMKVQSLKPEAMESHLDLYLSLLFESRSISREICELIGVIVSLDNGCKYCINHHAEALAHFWKDEEKLEDLIESIEKVELEEKNRVVVDYVLKLTKTPEDMVEDDLEELRKAGFTDEQILNINMIAAYFNFVNRIALGLGVEFSEEEMKGYNY